MSVIAGARTSMGKDKMVDRAIMQFHLSLEGKKEKRPTGPPRVIAITRQLGSGGRRIGEALGERLGWPVYDKEILEMLARKSHAGYRKEMFEAVDETTQSEIERMLNAFLGQADQSAYFYLLPKAILTLAQINCIILGRGANLLLPDALKVRVEASMPTRLANMMRFENLSAEQARRKIKLSDRSRDKFLNELLSILPAKYQGCRKRLMYDLVINTDCFSPADAAAMIALAAERKFGCEAA